jgi:hypothetical protein
VFHRQSRTDLEQRLTVALRQFVEDLPAGRVGQGLEHVTLSGGVAFGFPGVTHPSIIGKS